MIDALEYEAQASGVSSGRVPDGSPYFYPLATLTPGAANGAARQSDIVINEIMYSPISGDNNDEFIELSNRGLTAVNVGRWRFTAGISFTFPDNTIIQPDGYLVVAKNANRLRVNYANLTAAKWLTSPARCLKTAPASGRGH